MSDECPRQITFLIPGNPGVWVTATEVNGTLEFTVDVDNSAAVTADLRGFFFHFNEAQLGDLEISGGGGLITNTQIGANSVIDLLDGANMSGSANPFDVGIRWGTPGGKKDDIHYEVSFTLSNTAGDLTLDDIAHMEFGARLDSVGGPGGKRGGVSKIVGTAPAAPDAVDDSYDIFEDGADGLNDPSKDPTGVELYVLGNDTDGDGDTLLITAIHHGPEHGTVEISADGTYLIYTPDLDYSGTDTFEYCVTDQNGGQDYATVNIDVEAVADDPVITYEVAQGANINQIILTVTATQDDDDGSEYVDDLFVTAPDGLPAGVSVNPSFVDPATTPGSITQQFIIDTAAETDYDFDLLFNATSVEASNGDTEVGTETVPIVIDFTHNQSTLDFLVQDQSTWSSGEAYVFDESVFLGVDTGFGDATDIVVAGWDFQVNIVAGFDATIHFEAGEIDAEVPLEVTVDTTYNKTTDTLLIDPGLAIAGGGGFTATGPSGYFDLDFLFDLWGHAYAHILGIDVINLSFDESASTNIFSLDSSDAAFSWLAWPGVATVDFAWPTITTYNDPGLLSGDGASNDFLALNVDLDQLANQLLGGLLSFIDPDPLDNSNFELLDLDISGGMNLLQDFAISLASQSVDLVFEDGHTESMTFGSPMMVSDVSSHDANNDGVIEFDFALDPNLQLSNTTDLGIALDFYLAIMKNVGDLGTFYSTNSTIPIAEIEVFNDTFDLQVAASQDFGFLV